MCILLNYWKLYLEIILIVCKRNIKRIKSLTIYIYIFYIHIYIYECMLLNFWCRLFVNELLGFYLYFPEQLFNFRRLEIENRSWVSRYYKFITCTIFRLKTINIIRKSVKREIHLLINEIFTTSSTTNSSISGDSNVRSSQTSERIIKTVCAEMPHDRIRPKIHRNSENSKINRRH